MSYRGSSLGWLHLADDIQATWGVHMTPGEPELVG
jgi:hypothetical protein